MRHYITVCEMDGWYVYLCSGFAPEDILARWLVPGTEMDW